MKRLIILLLFLPLFIINDMSVFAQKKIVGYYPVWKKSLFPPSAIDYKKLTHINVAFAWPNKDGSIGMSSGLVDTSLINQAHANGVKVLVSFGGADTSTSNAFAVISSHADSRSVFINNLLTFILDNNFDGVDLDWEFPSTLTERDQYTALVNEIRDAFNRVNTVLLLTAAVGPGGYSGQWLDYNKFIQSLDWVNMMGYDFRGSWTEYTGHNAPLYANPKDPTNQGSDNDGIIYLNASRRIPKEKIILGVPFYGKEFNASGLFAKQTGAVLDQIYNTDIYPKMNSLNWQYYWDDVSDVPYLLDTAQTKFVTFDDSVSIRLKCEYVKQKDLAGIMIWALGYDYVNGDSQLLNIISNSLSVSTSVELAENNSAAPSDYILYDNYPNPFNPSTIIRFKMPQRGHAKLSVFDVLGREIEVLYNQYFDAGIYEARFDASRTGCSSGIYFYVLVTNNFIQAKKMILVK